MKYLFRGLFLFVLSAFANRLNAQLLPAFRAEQDACGALELCGNTFSTSYSYQGEGFVQDMPNTPCGSGEQNSMWLKLNVTGAGKIMFTITPVVVSDDYDFAIMLGSDCNNLTYQSVVRCNFNQNQQITNNGVVGLDSSTTDTEVPSGTVGSNYVRYIDAVVGQTYYIMINNFGSGGNPSAGFTINFAGTTATFENIAPGFQVATQSCFVGTSTVVNLNKEVLCSSIAANGSDFTISPSGNVVSAQGLNCSNGGQGYATEIGVAFSPALAPGTYYLKAKNGTDGNSLVDVCGNSTPPTDSIKIVVYPNNSTVQSNTYEGCASVLYNGKIYTESQIVTDTIFTSYGCDSVYSQANIVVYNHPTIFPETITQCDSVVFRGIVYKQPTVVIDTFRNHLGCDSFIHIYNLTPQHLTLSLDVDPPEPVIGDHVVFTVSSNLPDYNITAWYPQNVFSNQFSTSQTIFIQHSDTVIVVGVSSGGCIDTLKTFVKADTLVPVLVMPNAFSPNGDGLNDVFEPKFVNKSGFVVKNFRVFDRWGKLVYLAAATKKAGWNGTYSNNDKVADLGTYFYIIDVQFIDGTKATVKGDVTLLR
jgi:gliding motility-associated-like protein